MKLKIIATSLAKNFSLTKVGYGGGWGGLGKKGEGWLFWLLTVACSAT